MQTDRNTGNKKLSGHRQKGEITMFHTAVGMKYAPRCAMAAALGYLGRGLGVQYGPWIVNRLIDMTVKKGLTRFLVRQGAHLALGGMYPVVGQVAVTAALIGAPSIPSAARASAQGTLYLAREARNLARRPQADRERKAGCLTLAPEGQTRQPDAGGNVHVSAIYGKWRVQRAAPDQERALSSLLIVSSAPQAAEPRLPDVREGKEAGFEQADDYLVVSPEQKGETEEPEAPSGATEENTDDSQLLEDSASAAN